MRHLKTKAAVVLFSSAMLLNCGCSSYFARQQPLCASQAEIQKKYGSWAVDPIPSAKSALLSDPKIARIEGIGRLMESASGQCALSDLARMGDSEAMHRKAARIFRLLSSAERLFLWKYRDMWENRELYPRASRLEIACLAFWHAMEWNFVKPEQGVRFLDGLGARVPHADCDVSGIMFLDFARQVGLDVVGLRITYEEEGKRWHFLCALRGDDGKITRHIETTYLMGQEEGVEDRLLVVRAHVLSRADSWKKRMGKVHPGANCAYLEPEDAVKTYYLGLDNGFGSFSFE